MGEINLTEDAFEELCVVWVKAYGIPIIVRSEMVVKEFAYLVGDPEEIDKESLNRKGRVRVRVAWRDPSKIKGEMFIFINRDIEFDGRLRSL